MVYAKRMTEDELYHHGILGMKWGKRNGPPYPLDYESHSSAEKSQNSKGKLDNYDTGTKIKRDKSKEEKNGETKKKKEISKQDIEEFRKEAAERYKNKPEQAERYRKMSDQEIADDIAHKQALKKTIIITAVAVGVTAASYYAIKSGAIERLMNQEEFRMHYLNRDGITKMSKEQAQAIRSAIGASMSDFDFVLDKKSIIHRMDSESAFSLDKKAFYASFKKSDVNLYSSLLRDWKGGEQKFDYSLKATKDIKIAGEKKAREIIEEALRTDISLRNEIIEAITEKHVRLQESTLGAKLSQSDISLIKNQVEDMFKQDEFGQSIYSFVLSKGPREKLAKAFTDRNYSGVIDFFDKGTDFSPIGKGGRSAISDTPIILFNAKNDFVEAGKKIVDTKYKKDALRSLGLWDVMIQDYGKELVYKYFGLS